MESLDIFKTDFNDNDYLLSIINRLTKMATKAPVVKEAVLVTGIVLGILHKGPVHNWPQTHLKFPFLFTHVAFPKQGGFKHSLMSIHVELNIW